MTGHVIKSNPQDESTQFMNNLNLIFNKNENDNNNENEWIKQIKLKKIIFDTAQELLNIEEYLDKIIYLLQFNLRRYLFSVTREATKCMSDPLV